MNESSQIIESGLANASGESPLVRVRSLSKSFPAVGREPLIVLSDVNLDVFPGEVVAIVGESGSGKSTLLHILGALDRPDSGELLFNNESLLSRSDKDLSDFRNKRIGFVFQFHHLLPEFSALENVMMPALVSGMAPSAASPRAMELLDRVGLTHRASHRPGELSGGEKQRVAMARALMNDPVLILADEPTGNLDEQTAEQLHNEMIRLSREINQTFILVTHNKGFALLADRVFSLEHGILTQQMQTKLS
ncbi:ABC transporter ATP-binding protein [bacterium]|nr:ABC transporter ATP-binding protein [bacterium]